MSLCLTRSCHPRLTRENPVFESKMKDSFLDFWWQELLACGSLILYAVGIVIILAVHDGQPLPKWPFKLTLNALISILVVVLKATTLATLASGMEVPNLLSYHH